MEATAKGCLHEDAHGYASTTAVYLLRLADVLVHSLLVAPVCGHAVLSDPVHLARPDLDLHGHAVSAQHHRMQ